MTFSRSAAVTGFRRSRHILPLLVSLLVAATAATAAAQPPVPVRVETTTSSAPQAPQTMSRDAEGRTTIRVEDGAADARAVALLTFFDAHVQLDLSARPVEP